MRRALVASVAILLVSSLAGTAQAQEAPSATPLEKVVAFTQPSVVFLDITWTGWVWDKFYKEYLNEGDPFVVTSYCSAFVVNPEGYVATAGHCVDQANITPDFFDHAAAWALENDYYEFDKGETFEDVRGWADEDFRLEGDTEAVSGQGYNRGADLTIQAVWSTESTEPLHDKYGDLNGEPHDARLVELIPWNSGEGDTALLKVEATDLPPALPIAPADGVTTGTEVISIGYPASVGEVSDTALSDPSFKEGSVSSVRTNGTWPVYEMDAAMSGGMSGGPTVDLKGRLVGINSYGILDEASEFQFVQSAETLQALMNDTGISSEIGEIGTAYRAGLDAYFAGDKTVAVERLEAALAVDHDFAMAGEFLRKAQALPDPSSPIVPIGIGIVVLLALVGGGLFLKRRSASPKAVEPTMEVPMTKEAASGGDFCTTCGSPIMGVAYCGVCGTKVAVKAQSINA
jgi:serine protease Do